MNETQTPSALPFVSVIIPIRNEEGFIGATLDSILAQDYPADRMEIIVADGMSDDRTREIVRRYASTHPFIRLIDNPARVTPTALNLAIAAARGDVISRVDGHCHVAPDFVSQNVKLLDEHPEAWIVGGPIVHAGTGAFGQAVALAMGHPLGVGMASHRFPGFEGYVDTVQFPAFRRWVFDRVGTFDVNLVRTEDDELNYRVASAGGRMFVSPRVRYVYYVRNRIDHLFWQYFHYSFWRIPVMRKHKKPTTVRQIVPLVFFLTMAGLLLSAPWLPPFVSLALPAIYLAAMAALVVSLLPQHGLRVSALTAVAVVVMHVAYAAGLGYGLFAAAMGKRAWSIDGTMSALSR
jgi:glycosyltransferase involved in cell wall biosynthesis